MKFYFLFSYWILIWFLLHKCNIIYFNPFFAFVCIVCFDIYMYFYKQNINSKNSLSVQTFKFYIVMMIHYFPFLFLKFSINIQDICFTLLLFIIYLYILHKKQLKLTEIYIQPDSFQTIQSFIIKRFTLK